MTYSIPDLADHPWAKLHPEYFADEPVTPLPPSGEERSLDILQRLRWFAPVTPRLARTTWLRIARPPTHNVRPGWQCLQSRTLVGAISDGFSRCASGNDVRGTSRFWRSRPADGPTGTGCYRLVLIPPGVVPRRPPWCPHIYRAAEMKNAIVAIYGVVIRPTESLPRFTNHKAPSGPAAMSYGCEMPGSL